MKRPTKAQAKALQFGARLGWICLTDYSPGTQRVLLANRWVKRNHSLKHGQFADITDAGRVVAASPTKER